MPAADCGRLLGPAPCLPCIPGCPAGLPPPHARLCPAPCLPASQTELTRLLSSGRMDYNTVQQLATAELVGRPAGR